MPSSDGWFKRKPIVTLEDGTSAKQCPRCKRLLPLSKFHKCRDGKASPCKECVSVYMRSYYVEHGVTWKAHLHRQYKLTPEQYEEMVAAQGGVCAICGEIETISKGGPKGYVRKLAVDHNHSTGVIRGLLCHRCNVTLGLMHEDVELLKNAIDYLEQHNGTAIEATHSRGPQARGDGGNYPAGEGNAPVVEASVIEGSGQADVEGARE